MPVNFICSFFGNEKTNQKTFREDFDSSRTLLNDLRTAGPHILFSACLSIESLEKLHIKYIQKTHEDDKFYANIGYSFSSCLTIIASMLFYLQCVFFLL